MVFLNDLQSQYPWNGPEELSDKEIYTHMISHMNPTAEWRIPLGKPLEGYAFTGLRVVVYGKTSEYTIVPRLFKAGTEESVFGLPWDNTLANNGSWAPLGFPLTKKIIGLTENGLEYVVKHNEPCWGKVEFIGQRFDDLLEKEDVSYLFLNHRTDKSEWILTEENSLYRPQLAIEPLYRGKVKLMPSILRLLEKDRNKWPDSSTFWNQVSLAIPLFQ